MITERDRYSQLLTAELKGIEKVAKNLKDNKMPIEEIVANTGLTLEQIEAL